MNGLMDQFWQEFLDLVKEFKFPLENPILTFSILLLIILVSPILLRKFRIPALIGLIISGVIIGPHGINMISESVTAKSGFVGMFATFGLLYIMFMAGLELDMQEFKRYRNKSITFGALTFFIPLLLGYPVCRYALGLNEMASLLTASMFATHTLVAYPIVSKYGISKMEAVAIAIGGTILTDTAVLIILAVISGSDNGVINANVLIHLGVTLTIFSIIMFWLVPIIARWFFSKLESEKSSHYIFVLAILFFAAFLAEAAGIEAIIGAFVAGLVLNRLIPHSSTLMNRIEFIGNSLFIPFFLIAIGMVVNVKALYTDPWAWAVAGILTAFAIFSKFLAAWFTQLLFRMKASERQVIFGLSTAHAAATLAVIRVGYDMHLLSIDIVNGTVILILITSMTASFVTESAGKRLLIDQAKSEPLEGPALRSQHLMVAANELIGNEQLLDFSILITDKKVINPISVVSVLDNDGEAEKRIRRSRKHMDDFIHHYSGGEISVQAMATIDHNFSSGVARVSKELVADIVLINDNSSLNFLKRLVGDDRDHLLDVCEKSVFFCQFNQPFTTYRTIALICPPFAELETSFNQWLERVFRISKELNSSIEVYATPDTYDKIDAYKTFRKFGAKLKHFIIEDPEETLRLLENKQEYALLVAVFSRKGSVSSFLGMDLLPQRMERQLDKMDRIFIYPAQQPIDSAFGSYDDINAGPLTAITRLSKGVGDIFRKTEEEKTEATEETDQTKK
ncbi:MAG: sodium:proton antiporter [Candidatus Fluviicola riflensis]|nr:MAG: sodium:proton antiporter [Candidatus Fluviicola riflensis]